MKIYGMSLVWAGSISLDSTLKSPRKEVTQTQREETGERE
jgi:hypothetical protein